MRDLVRHRCVGAGSGTCNSGGTIGGTNAPGTSVSAHAALKAFYFSTGIGNAGATFVYDKMTTRIVLPSLNVLLRVFPEKPGVLRFFYSKGMSRRTSGVCLHVFQLGGDSTLRRLDMTPNSLVSCQGRLITLWQRHGPHQIIFAASVVSVKRWVCQPVEADNYDCRTRRTCYCVKQQLADVVFRPLSYKSGELTHHATEGPVCDSRTTE